MNNEDINKKGFLPLEELERIAKEKQNNSINKPNEFLNIKKENPKLVYDKKIYTKYEVRPDTFFYIKFGLKWLNESDDEESKRLIIAKYDKSEKNIECHWMKFRMWTYEESNFWKNQCTEMDAFKNYVFNKNKLFKIKIKNLLIDWSFKEEDVKMSLMHVNNILSDESINLFMNLHPNILFYVDEKLRDILELNN